MKRTFVIITLVTSLLYYLKTVSAGFFCPPVVYNVNYKMVLEVQDFPVKCDKSSNITIVINSVEAFTCNVTTCWFTDETNFDHTAPRVLGKNSALQYKFTMHEGKVINIILGNYTARWSCQDQIRSYNCVVRKGEENECDMYTPCMYGSKCEDQTVGYKCLCPYGYSGLNCSEGDLELYCNTTDVGFSSYGQVCSQPQPVHCYLAGSHMTPPLHLSIPENSAEINVTTDAINETITFKICFTTLSRPGNYIINGTVTAGADQEFIITFNVSLGDIFLNVPEIGFYTFKVNESKAINESIATVQKVAQVSQCDNCILVLDNKHTENINLIALFAHQEINYMINYDTKLMRFVVANKLTGPQIINAQLKAWVGETDFGSVNVTFEIIDEPVVCESLTLTFPAIDIRVKNANLTKINCSSQNMEKLNYSVNQSYSEYFKVTEDGVLQVIKSLISLRPGAHTFNIYVNDLDTPIQVYIFLTVPGIDCQWNFSSPLPSIWTINTSVSLQLECDDLTSYSYINGPFIITDSLNNNILNLNLTLSRTFAGVYNLTVNLTNSAGNFTLQTIPITVFYKPVVMKLNDSYVFENQKINDQITDIKVLTDTPIAVLIFNIAGGNQDNIFSVISSNGTVIIGRNLTLATRETYELKIQITVIKDNTSQLETLADLKIQILPVCNLTIRNSHWCENSKVGTLQCLQFIRFLVLPNITSPDDNFKASVSDNGYVQLEVPESCLFNSSLSIIASYRNYQTNLTWMIHTYEDCFCIQEKDRTQSPLVFCVYEECEEHCNSVSTVTSNINVTEESTTSLRTTEETSIQVSSTSQTSTEEPTIQVLTEISIFQSNTTAIYSVGDFYFNGTIYGNDRKLFKLIKNEDGLQLFLTQDLSEMDVGPYQLTFRVINAINITTKFIINVTVKALQICGSPVFLYRYQTEKGNEIYKMNCSILLNDTAAKIEYKLLRTVPGEVQIQINDNSIILSHYLPVNCTNFTIALNATYGNVIKYVKVEFIISDKYCSRVNESDGVVFNATPAGQIYTAHCPKDRTGNVSRYCQMNAAWGPYSFLERCSIEDISQAADLAKSLNSSSLNMSVVKEIFERVNSSLNKNQTLGPNDLQNMLFVLKNVSNVFSESQAAMEIATVEIVVRMADQLVSANTSMWADKETEAADILESMELLASAATKSLTEAMKNNTIVTNNIAVTLNAYSNRIEYDSTIQDGWMSETVDKIYVLNERTPESFNYSIILYKNLADSIKLNRSLQEKYNEVNNNLLNKTMNSRIISLTINDVSIVSNSNPVKITLALLNNSFSEPICGFLNTSVGEKGLWSTGGCTVESFSKYNVTCSCNHLTNFAVLMSPAGSFGSILALSIISIVGCSISLFCLVLTVVTYLVLWKYIKNDRSVLHMNLSLCLIIGYIVFLAGIEKTGDKVGCAVVAALLHFFFLAVFFIMLAEGIEIIKSVSFVFTSKSILRYLLAGAYGIPLLIVSVSLAITQTNGYGNDKYCWLSVDDGIIWAFVGPVIMVFLANLIILIVVIRTMQTSQIIKDKSLPDKVKSALRSICILSPILGLAWIFGVLSVNKESIVFQYLFAIFNSLQGLFIFIFQCFLQYQVRDGLKEKRRKYKAKSIDSGQRLVSNSSSVHGYSDSYLSKSNTGTQSSSVSEQAYDFPLFPNAVYKNRRDSKSSQEEVTSNSSADDTRGCISPIKQKNEKNIENDLKRINFNSFHRINSHISDTKFSYGMSFRNPGFLNNEDDLNYDAGNTLKKDNSRVQARERWKKVQISTKSGRIMTEKNAKENILASQMSTKTDSYKNTEKKKSLHQLPPLIIPRPTAVIGQSPGYHSNI
ncbi:hypothetical protein Btru_055101 [Bulinus truncatus]|nr:hypothetical protein Btru_055101 [Bulinus truncatus]